MKISPYYLSPEGHRAINQARAELRKKLAACREARAFDAAKVLIKRVRGLV